MTTKQAAECIGCSITHVRTLIALKQLAATKKPTDQNQHGYVLDVSEEEVARFICQERTEFRGCPRGSKRKQKDQQNVIAS
jgi:hypothetical protein